jgi:protein-S-isoprenylcysteine O-methyltransferase Ste14
VSRAAALAGTIAFLIAPAIVAGFIPWVISRWEPQLPLGDGAIFPGLGALMIAAGAIALLDSFFRFATEGLGTPSPLVPTQTLVVRGLYRYVRNPMYLALVIIVCGQALLLGNWLLMAYAAVIWAVTHAFVVLYEEPTLRKAYGKQYDAYCAQVARWLPFRAQALP